MCLNRIGDPAKNKHALNEVFSSAEAHHTFVQRRRTYSVGSSSRTGELNACFRERPAGWPVAVTLSAVAVSPSVVARESRVLPAIHPPAMMPRAAALKMAIGFLYRKGKSFGCRRGGFPTVIGKRPDAPWIRSVEQPLTAKFPRPSSGLAKTLKSRSFPSSRYFLPPCPHLADCRLIHPYSESGEIGPQAGNPEFLPHGRRRKLADSDTGEGPFRNCCGASPRHQKAGPSEPCRSARGPSSIAGPSLGSAAPGRL